MAKAAANKNPYSAPEGLDDNLHPQYVVPNSSAFAAPSPMLENGTMDSPTGAYSDILRTAPGATPDPQRIGVMPVREDRPAPAQAPEVFWRGIDADRKARHSVETLDADGWEEFKAGSGKRAAPNPRSVAAAESRPTMRLSPANWSFTRPMWGGPRDLTGMHFSMADHRRNYPILGMQPVRNWRNTYRLPPLPYDLDMVDVPPNDPTDLPTARIQSVEVPMASPVRRLR